MNKSELTKLIMRLADAFGVSGSEQPAAELCLELMKKYTDRAYIKNKSVFAEFGVRSDSLPHVLIDAHLDRVGLIAAGVTDGFVKAECVGGIDARLLPAQTVMIHGREDIPGVICTLPPHLKKDKSVMDKSSIYIDTLLSPKSAAELIFAGDSISFHSPSKALSGGRICAAGLDDRCGIAAVIAAVDELSESGSECAYSFTVMFSAEEEIGERGACTGAYEINPDISIAVDVSFAMSKGEDPIKCASLGGGCMIGISPSLDRELSRRFISYCKRNDIPFKEEVMSGATGTNADRFSVNRCGSRAVTLSVPLRYMHTPAEVIDTQDVCVTASLIAAFLKGEI